MTSWDSSSARFRCHFELVAWRPECGMDDGTENRQTASKDGLEDSRVHEGTATNNILGLKTSPEK